MVVSGLCAVCGNEIAVDVKQCPFCGAVAEVTVGRRGPRHKVVNLERGMPLVEQAMTRLARELELSRAEQCRVVTLIHGYGSSGRGGVIRQEVRARLQYLKMKRSINDFLPGEEFSSRTAAGRQLLRRFPFLSQHRDLNRANPGMTLVII